MTLPARKEGIIPGAANLRLPRFTGDRLARQLIQAERRLQCDSAEGRLICDEIVPGDGHGRRDRAHGGDADQCRARWGRSATGGHSASRSSRWICSVVTVPFTPGSRRCAISVLR